jgi:hypothetical protein
VASSFYWVSYPCGSNGSTYTYTYPYTYSYHTTAPVQVKPQPEIDIPMMVRQTMLLGGIWDQGSMFDYLCPRASRNVVNTTNNSKEYNAVGHTLRAMFNNDDCAKYVFYRKGSQSRASKEFFLCYPNNVELVEYEDGDIGEDEA